jgi:hypothetical protein
MRVITSVKGGTVETDRKVAAMSVEELRAELERTKDNLCDFQEMHAFTFGGKTTLHMGAEKAQAMQVEFEEECKLYQERICEIEKELKARGAL